MSPDRLSEMPEQSRVREEKKVTRGKWKTNLENFFTQSSAEISTDFYRFLQICVLSLIFFYKSHVNVNRLLCLGLIEGESRERRA